jgi:hypothetical protein
VQAAKPPAVEALPPALAGKEEGVPRRSYRDITARACFDHAADYSWLSGELQHAEGSNAWRLRYASVDENDAYGGSVTLMGSASLAGFKNGQSVRLTGHMADPQSHVPSPVYVVSNIETLPSLP